MKWETINSIDLDEFLNRSDQVKSSGPIEVVFHDETPTDVVIKLQDGRFLRFASREVDHGGCREGLFVSVTKKENENGG